ncbi:cobalamin-dependent protein [Streptomyces sp. RKAG290]|uniref:cobalamin B12-binding domain-containing protein n=1 Tax=Streptomyces sp. RKAG290 TaxID=2888348 RepID=UPI0020334AD8|nr:cobalamin-dependent protein [Streptomyces sp. RKAG290]MCM2414275.1 cobalamin-dependent protein [Streptomyces sp. RKAG290]
MSEATAIRVVMAKPGPDGGGSPPVPIVEAFGKAGFETVIVEPVQNAEGIVETALRVRADAICVSSLLGEHTELFAGVTELLRERGGEHITVIGGGIIPSADIPALKQQGVAEIFSAGTPTWAVVEWIREHVRQHTGA